MQRQDFWNEWQVAGGKLCLSMGLKVVIIFSLQISLCLEYEDFVQRCVKYQRSTSWIRKQIKDESYSSDICDKQFLIRQCLCSLHESPSCLLDYLLHVCYEQQNGVVKVLSRKLIYIDIKTATGEVLPSSVTSGAPRAPLSNYNPRRVF